MYIGKIDNCLLMEGLCLAIFNILSGDIVH